MSSSEYHSYCSDLPVEESIIERGCGVYNTFDDMDWDVKVVVGASVVLAADDMSEQVDGDTIASALGVSVTDIEKCHTQMLLKLYGFKK